MSYILEALKKAQAQRQLGETPTIHALPIQSVPGADGKSTVNKPLWLALVTGGLIVAVLLLLAWRQPQVQPAIAPAVAVLAPAIAPVVVPVIAPVIAPVVAPAIVIASPVRPVTKRAETVLPVAAPAVRKPVPASEVAVAPATPDETLQTLRDLPEPIQREIPAISLGGYIYSKNPADRLLLIDKVLRHEGEELAPGLVLEKLLPKAAVFSYRGYRYRVAY